MTSVIQHPASPDAYIRHGWSLVPIPPNSKGPNTPGWNQRTALLADHALLLPSWNIGLAHAYSGTMAVDVDEWGRAAAELAIHGIDLQALFDAPDAVVIDSGRQGHGKLIYAMPFGLALPSHKWMDSRFSIEKMGIERYNYLDFRCGTANGLTVQDVLPPSIHPLTGRPYQWAGRGHWTRLPQIPEALLALWTRELQRATERPVAPATASNASWDEVKGALRHISPDCSRDEWITVGMALHHAGTMLNDLAAAATTWDQWSAGSTKYPGGKAMEVQWRSFRSDKSTSVKLGSLFHLAQRGGWVRPAPDAASLFSQVEMTPPRVVAMNLLPPPPDIDFGVFPPVLARAADDLGAAIGCDPLVPLFAGLAAVSGAADARTRLELRPGFKVPPVLWVMTLGNPSDKKSPGSAPMFDVLNELEREDRPRYQQALQVYEALEARHEAAKRAYLDAAKDTESLLSGDIPNGYGTAPVPPSPLRTLTMDVNSHKLVRIGAGNPRGVLCYLDEMNSWCGKLGDPRSGEDKSTWVAGFESRYYKLDRVGAGEIEAENYAVSIYGNIQPRVFANHVHKLSEDGLLQRFIPVKLRPEMTRLGQPHVGQFETKRAFDMMVRSVYGLPAMTYKLASDAEELFIGFQRWYHQRVKDEMLLRAQDVYMQALGKIEGLMGRVILLFHLMTEPFSMNVSSDTVEKVIQLTKGYIVPSMRFVYNGELTGSTSFDRWMMEHIIQYADATSLTLREIKAAASHQLTERSAQTKTDMVVAAMYTLEQAGWVVRKDDGSEQHRGIGEWFINPALREQFADHRRNVIVAKQRMLEYVNEGRFTKRDAHGYNQLTGTTG